MPMPMPMPMPTNPNIRISQDAAPDFTEQGKRIIATQLKGSTLSFGAPASPATLGIAMPASGNSTPVMPAAGSSPPVMPPHIGDGLSPSTASVLATLATLGTPVAFSAPPLVVVPTLAGGIGVPQGTGIPEYNVSTPYGEGPGLNPTDAVPVERDRTGRPVLTVKTPTGKSSKSWLLWVGAALAAAYYL